MSALGLPRDQNGYVDKRQSTYWDLHFQGSGLWRIHFKGKKEFWYDEPGTFDSLCICTEHPLLADYQDPWDCVYLAGPFAYSIDLIDRLNAVVDEETDGWRSATRYLNPGVDLCALVEGGFGLFFRAPRRIGRRMAQVLYDSGVKWTNQPYGGDKNEGGMALILDRSFVIAEGFQYENLAGSR